MLSNLAFVKFTWHMPLLIINQLAPEKGPGEPNLVPPETGICPGALSRGVRDARWTQIDAIARADVPWRPVEWRLPCHVNCRKVWDRALTRLGGPCVAGPSPAGGLPANHRASGYALECCLEGFGSLDGHKSMPSRERICLGGP